MVAITLTPKIKNLAKFLEHCQIRKFTRKLVYLSVIIKSANAASLSEQEPPVKSLK